MRGRRVGEAMEERERERERKGCGEKGGERIEDGETERQTD